VCRFLKPLLPRRQRLRWIVVSNSKGKMRFKQPVEVIAGASSSKPIFFDEENEGDPPTRAA